MFQLPRLYPILDPTCFPDAAAMFAAAQELAAAGVTLLQYRNKCGNARQMLAQARELKARLSPSVKLIMNDRADLCLAAGCDGLHIGQDDLFPESARRIIGPSCWLGVSTHNPEQLAEADPQLAQELVAEEEEYEEYASSDPQQAAEIREEAEQQLEEADPQLAQELIGESATTATTTPTTATTATTTPTTATTTPTTATTTPTTTTTATTSTSSSPQAVEEEAKEQASMQEAQTQAAETEEAAEQYEVQAEESEANNEMRADDTEDADFDATLNADD